MVRFSSILAAAACFVAAESVTIKVDSKGGNATSGHQYGFLHEDINNSGDGGIYAELVRNRAFQYSKKYPVNLSGWRSINGANLSLNRLDDPLSKALPVSMSVKPGKKSQKQIGFLNEGYWGMDVKKQKYTGSFWVKGAYKGHFTASLQSNLTDDVFGSVKVKSKANKKEWVEHEFELVPKKNAPNSNNTFAITFDPKGAEGSLDFNLISLFPPTYKNRKNGLRVDLAEALEGLHPSLLRFPGGNMLEGNTNKTWWDWKDTLGPLRNRPGFEGVWSYQQTHGLGLMEYLLWAEDMKLEIILGVYAGLSLDGGLTSKEDLQPFIDDALDEIEFIRGPADSKWGKRRAELGHPEPFKLHYVEVGNEDWLAGYPSGWDSYKEYRLPMFKKAISEAYDDITVIASGYAKDPVAVKGEGIDLPDDVLGDYHPYREPNALVDEFDLFDNEVPHIVGEVAATHPNGGTKNMNKWQWAVTIVQFAADSAMTTRSTSWYVWELFAGHPMSHTLPASADFDPLFYVTGKNEDKDSFIWKGAVYNTTKGADVPVSLSFQGVKPGAQAKLTLLTNLKDDPFAHNDPHTGVNIVKTTKTVLKADRKGAFNFKLPELSVAVLETIKKGKLYSV
ncbi:hypothetical protein FSARC_11625 [Fusarium sarcochroum]|uniref:non-reducing end alpha-L-arabinofuranosidase n=1 Tax=Fusarium sarcochroum TaxID=1208366 RepID=A0A8H4TE31_9HYPO|nr:hypothetical protein FSARC_11625 [Fusarium sarcochroum]